MKIVTLRTLGLSLILALLLTPAFAPVSQARAPTWAQVALTALDYSPPGGSGETLEPLWVERTPVTSPAARCMHAMAYDSARGVTVLLGGNPINPSDTWEWDGFSWVERTPTTRPRVRSYHAMAFDSARGVTVLFGGWDIDELDDTWEWDGINWVLRFDSDHTPRAARSRDGLRQRPRHDRSLWGRGRQRIPE